MTPDTDLKIRDICSRFNVTPWTIYRWIRDEKFPAPVKLNRRKSRWNASDVDAWALTRPELVANGAVSA